MLPNKITPCPIVDALVEVRFLTTKHPDAVFGLFYEKIRTDFTTVEKLPILQLPDSIRSSDSSLRFKPHFKVNHGEFVIQIGPEVITISSYPKYVGWDTFSKNIYTILSKIHETMVIEKVVRLGTRYINFFENDIFHHIDLSLKLKTEKVPLVNTLLRTEIAQEKFNSTLQIANNAISNDKTGSIIDIDTFTVLTDESFFENMITLIEEGHNKEKELFFSLLDSEYLSQFNPQY